MLLAIQHRFSQHYSFMANYTWSHCISEADAGGDLGQASAMVMNPYSLRQDLGNCASDRRQIFNSSVIAQTPQCASTLLRRSCDRRDQVAIVTVQSGLCGTVTTAGRGPMCQSHMAAEL